MKFTPPPENPEDVTKEYQEKEANDAKDMYNKFITENKITLTQAYTIAMNMLVDVTIEMPNDASRMRMIHTLRDSLMEGTLIESMHRLEQAQKKNSGGIQ